jgi:hypothetical protein
MRRLWNGLSSTIPTKTRQDLYIAENVFQNYKPEPKTKVDG